MNIPPHRPVGLQRLTLAAAALAVTLPPAAVLDVQWPALLPGWSSHGTIPLPSPTASASALQTLRRD